MNSTRIFITALAAASVFVALPAAAQPSKLRCINVKDIRDTVSRDSGKTLTFKLRDGTTVVNHLRQQCDSLDFAGFVWATSPNGEVCENAQTLRTIANGDICRLGKFDAPVKSAAAAR